MEDSRRFYYDDITCPYCFRHFSHKDVDFRLETVKRQNYSQAEIERRPDGPEKEKLLAEYELTRFFVSQDDPAYTGFWEKYGGTTEKTTNAERGRFNCEVYQLPIVDPKDYNAQRVLTTVSHPDRETDYFVYDSDGMVVGVTDVEGETSRRRVCPYCHNPLPLGYGKHRTKFISVIGVTRSGKTVYLSQLLKYMPLYTSMIGMTSNNTDDHVTRFITDNPVEMNRPLPNPNVAGRLSQPIVYDLIQGYAENRLTDTLVLYDIAGEDCRNATEILRFGDFVTHSDGIILLIDPSQLGLIVDSDLRDEARAAEPQLVLTTIHNAFVGNDTSKKCDKPMAVCISKSDRFDVLLPDVGRRDLTAVVDQRTGRNRRVFNATEYNTLEPAIHKMIKGGEGQIVDTQLDNEYSTYNYFSFSAIGCSVAKMVTGGQGDGERPCPEANPIPRRIAEPLFWLFQKFGFIQADTYIRLPYPRPYEDPVPIERTWVDKLLGRTRYRPLTPDERERFNYEETL